MEKNIKTITIVGMLSSFAGVLMLLEFAIPVFPSFLKMDFSDLPALVATFLFGSGYGIIVEFIKILINLLANGTTTGFIGETANFIIGISLVIPAGIVYKRNKTKKGALTGMTCGIISMTVVGAIVNYFVLIPFYQNFMPLEAIIKMCQAIIPYIDSLEKVILFSIIPFNLLKGIVVSIITFMLYKRMSHIFK